MPASIRDSRVLHRRGFFVAVGRLTLGWLLIGGPARVHAQSIPRDSAKVMSDGTLDERRELLTRVGNVPPAERPTAVPQALVREALVMNDGEKARDPLDHAGSDNSIAMITLP